MDALGFGSRPLDVRRAANQDSAELRQAKAGGLSESELRASDPVWTIEQRAPVADAEIVLALDATFGCGAACEVKLRFTTRGRRVVILQLPGAKKGRSCDLPLVVEMGAS